jgi:hypothetical protein
LINGTMVLVCVAVCGIVLASASAVVQRRARAVASNLAQILSGVLVSILGHGRLADLWRWVPDRQDMKQVRYGLAVCMGVCLAAGGVWAWRV